MKLVILAAGKLRAGWARRGFEEYASRIEELCGFETAEVKTGRPKAECSRMLSQVREADVLAACDGRGKEMTSEELAQFVQVRGTGRGRLVFAIGGAYGLTDEFRNRADHLLALSRMTLPHELARVVLTEQVYRALTIMRGLPYHH